MTSPAPQVQRIDRYALHGEIAAGGMATVHYGRLLGPAGFARTIAIKRLHPQFAKDPEFVAMFLDEARLAARIRHPNVVQTLDVVARHGELFLVMEYVQGESLHKLLRACRQANQTVPLSVLASIMCGALHGLHAAHIATNDHGEPLGIVHRDVSPQNVLVGADGISRVLDFGVAKAAGRVYTTQDGKIKGKLAYMTPEQLHSQSVDRRTDVFAMGIVLWEALTLQRLFAGDSEGATIKAVLEQEVKPPSEVVPGISRELDAVVLRALERDPKKRFEGARDMALALEECVPIASPTKVAAWVENLVGDVLSTRAQEVARIESNSLRQPQTEPTVDPVPVHLDASTISTSALRERLAPRRRAPVYIGGALVAIAVGVGATVLAQRVRAPAAPSALATESAVRVPVPSVTSVVVPSTASSERGPSQIDVPSATVAASVSHERPPIHVATTYKPPPSASKGCTVKSYLDESGIKHFVEECK